MVVRYPPPRRSRMGLQLAVFGAVPGLAAVLAALLWSRSAEPTAPQPATPAAQPVPTAPQPAPPQQKYSFYSDLQQEQVPVANRGETLEYWFQVGSFAHLEDARERRIRLILLGLDARLEQVRLGNATRHRVLVGPFAGRIGLSEARRLIEAEGFALMLRKTPPADAEVADAGNP